jgi:hypothetical protein
MGNARTDGPRDADRDGRRKSEARDPGAYIGHEPELAAERIPGGVRPEDERVAATQSEPAAPGEPEDEDAAEPGDAGPVSDK